MKRIITIEGLQDSLVMRNQIYEVDNYETARGKLAFSMGFTVWEFNDRVVR